ncbi:MAG: hypothetical protein JNM93_11900 [Bacteriovoracaceae bacterium]|nr:hypothetical protein [Bacteriovoracaceae bacterium]
MKILLYLILFWNIISSFAQTVPINSDVDSEVCERLKSHLHWEHNGKYYDSLSQFDIDYRFAKKIKETEVIKWLARGLNPNTHCEELKLSIHAQRPVYGVEAFYYLSSNDRQFNIPIESHDLGTLILLFSFGKTSNEVIFSLKKKGYNFNRLLRIHTGGISGSGPDRFDYISIGSFFSVHGKDFEISVLEKVASIYCEYYNAWEDTIFLTTTASCGSLYPRYPQKLIGPIEELKLAIANLNLSQIKVAFKKIRSLAPKLPLEKILFSNKRNLYSELGRKFENNSFPVNNDDISKGKKIIEYFIKQGLDINVRDESGTSIVEHSVSRVWYESLYDYTTNGYIAEMVKYLLQVPGVDFNREYKGFSLLNNYLRLSPAIDILDPSVILLFREKGVDFSQAPCVVDNIAVTKLLIEIIGESCFTLENLGLAVKFGMDDVAELYLKKGIHAEFSMLQSLGYTYRFDEAKIYNLLLSDIANVQGIELLLDEAMKVFNLKAIIYTLQLFPSLKLNNEQGVHLVVDIVSNFEDCESSECLDALKLLVKAGAPLEKDGKSVFRILVLKASEEKIYPSQMAWKSERFYEWTMTLIDLNAPKNDQFGQIKPILKKFIRSLDKNFLSYETKLNLTKMLRDF